MEKPTVVVIHGWKGYSNSPPSKNFYEIEKIFKRSYNVNVIRVEWEIGFLATYATAVAALPGITVILTHELEKKLEQDPILWRNLTIIGHSLGAHIGGKEKL